MTEKITRTYLHEKVIQVLQSVP